MKYSILLSMATSLVLITACSTTTSHSSKGSSLTLVQPANQTVVRGRTNDIMIAITRHNFSGPVTIRFEGLPQGVSLVESNATIADGSNVVTFTLMAELDAAVVSNQYVRIVASGADGLVSTEGFRVSVDAGA